MASDVKCLKVFIASPGGLEEERKAFREEIHDSNEADAVARGVLFQPIGWEDTLSGVGRPQSIINKEIEEADYFLLVLWDRWGSPPHSGSGAYTSGTEEEYHVALDCFHAAAKPMRQLVMMFKAVDYRQLSDPGPQLQSVLKFKSEVEIQKKHLFFTFDRVDGFRKRLRLHLAAWVRDEENRRRGGAGEPMPPDPIIGPEMPSDSGIARAPETLTPEASAIEKAWQLVNEGRLTEAEVEFARLIVAHPRPQTLTNYGIFLRRVGRPIQAMDFFDNALTAATNQNDELALADVYLARGMALHERGELTSAEDMLRKALEIYDKLGRLDQVGVCSRRLGLVLQARGELDRAEELCRNALAISQKLGLIHHQAEDYSNLGIVLRARGQIRGAEEMFRKSLDFEEKLGRLEGQAADLGNLGAVLQARGDLNGAEAMYRKALELNEKLHLLEGTANTYGNLGNLMLSRGNLEVAEQMYRKSLEIHEKLGDLQGEAITLGHLGGVMYMRGNLADAEMLCRRALALNQKMRTLEPMIGNYHYLAYALRARGEVATAEEMIRKALEIAENLQRLEDIVSSYLVLAEMLQTRGDLKGAREMYSKALENAEKLGSKELIARAKQSLGSCSDVMRQSSALLH